MAATKSSYDPVKAIEGMFNGSVTRIAQALEDPVGYSSNTKTVLAECAKRFHDALDDCEIHLLDAKWYLEHQLRTNRMRREAQAREMGTAAKRKHDDIKDTNESNNNHEVVAKKPKVEQRSEPEPPKKQSQMKEAVVEVKASQDEGSNLTKEADGQQRPKPRQDQKKNDRPALVPQSTQLTRPSQPANKSTESTNAPPAKAQSKEQAPPDEFAKPTPQATPTGTNDDFNFESMFGEPTGDQVGDGNKDDNDLNFDFTTGDFGLGNEAESQDPNLLDTLLPGLESYANQTDDNLLNSGNNTTVEDNNTMVDTNLGASNPQDTSALPSFSNDFDLPTMGGPNIFDDFLNDDTLGGADGVGTGGNFEDNIDLSDSALLDLDFDAFK